MDKTLVLIKPDAVEKRVWIEIIDMYRHSAGLVVLNSRIMSPLPRELAERLYAEHEGKPFYPELIGHMTQGTTIALLLSGAGAVEIVRKYNGATKPENAESGTIRRFFGTPGKGPANAVHGSASAEDAVREIAIFFGEE